ncbi:sulfotransferase [uncultured Pseudodesulfovibrio sp.]|uniref:sulfotransferase n=1 Tax=uncultured Pseudodesulfovibrio sp. TaxID=2035858 RepID=UPI0029C8CD5A|nr:sulfotransferase [uncultured Pseudodesulfovibrio sp.]
MQHRTLKRQASKRLGSVLAQLSSYLEDMPLQEDRTVEPDCLLICGAPRSGTSLLLQYLASSGLFAYPSNFISRFYSAPFVGEIAQQLILDPNCDYKGEFEDIQAGLLPLDFNSDLGKTKNALGVNEFWYFWRRFFPGLEYGERLTHSEWEKQGGQRFWLEIQEWLKAAHKPIVMKGLMANFSIEVFLKHNRKCRVLNIYRSPVDNMVSLLNARLSFYNDIEAWYSFKIPDSIGCSPLPEEQVALQVAFNQLHLQKISNEYPDQRVVDVSYESFCKAPFQVLESPVVKEMLDCNSCANDNAKSIPVAEFEPRTSSIMSDLPGKLADREYLFDVFNRQKERINRVIYG